MGMKYDIIILLSYFDGEYTRGRNKIDNKTIKSWK